MGWSRQTVFPLLIISASGGFTGLFVYSPTPGTGKLVDSIAAASGTDPYGNAYTAGFTNYFPGAPVTAIQMFAGLIQFLSAATEAGPYANFGQITSDGSGGISILPLSGHNVGVFNGSLVLATIGQGLQVAEGANARMGTATLAAGTVTIPNTTITANTRVYSFPQSAGANLGIHGLASRIVGTSFTITSSNAADANSIAWFLVEKI